jgi:uncharacterized protein YndB with AHSA1/START domain
MSEDVRFAREIDATTEKVFDAFNDHVFRVIDRPSRLVVDTAETRADGSSLEFETEFTFEEHDGKTLMTMIQRGLPTAELREEHRAGLPNAFARLQRAIEN